MNAGSRLTSLRYLLDTLQQIARILDEFGYKPEAARLLQVKRDVEAGLPKSRAG